MPGESSLSTNDQEHLRLVNALRESELLRELSELLASSLDLTHILQVLVRRTTEACEIERCAVWLLDESHSLLRPSAYHLSGKELNSSAIQMADNAWRRSTLPFADPTVYRLLEQSGVLAVEDLQAAPGTSMRRIAEKFLVRSVLIVALIREGRPVGLMSLDNPGRFGKFTREQTQLARAIGQQAAVAIHNAQLYQQAQNERRRAERLIGRAQSIYTVAMAVNSGEDLSQVLAIAARQLVQGLDADDAVIALLEGDNTLSIAAATTFLVPDDTSPPPMLSDLPYCSTAAQQGKPLFVSDKQMSEAEQRWFQQSGLKNVMVIPLMVGADYNGKQITHGTPRDENTTCVGFAFVNYPESNNNPPPGQYAFAQDIAAQCALAVEKAHILTKARQAAALATERANTLDALFNAMVEGITVVDLDGQVIISNRAASLFMGLPLQTKEHITTLLQRYPTYTLQGRPLAPEEFPLARALRGEHIRGERFITRRIDNSERAIEVNVAPLYDSEARQIGLVGAFRDVTEQVRVEQRIRLALDTMLHAAEAISGITDIKDILGRMLAMTMTALNCERGAVQLYNQEQQIFTPLLSIGFSAQEEARWLAAQQCWLAPEADQYVGFHAQLLAGHATLVNAEQCPECPDSFRETMILAAPIMHNRQLLGVMILDRSIQQKKNGSQRPIPTNEFRLWDIAVVEGIAQFAGLAIDQARWQQEAEIARTNEATMRESNALKDEFLAITAHEFRTPLTVILAHSQLIERTTRKVAEIKQPLRDKINESTAIIGEQAHQLTNIVNTFLEVTRIESGQIVLVLEDINLEEVVAQAVTNHSAMSKIHTISYSIEPCTHPYLVKGDKARLLQILGNLLQNAIKYSPHGGPITISLIQRSNEGGQPQIEVCVEDRGMGVPLDAQPHLFERFYRAANIQAGRSRGVGLGLYLVSELLRLQGGTIRVESSGIVGEGSRFIFTLPLCQKENIETHV
jgi:PAS domain S-box-containing protein